jgi:hypothetical protein
MTDQAAHRPPQVLITRSLARARHGWASLWSAASGRRVRTNTHEEFEKRIRELARMHPGEMGVFRTTLDEAPVVPVAMAMGASPEYSPTYQQKYPSPLNRVLERLTTEIEEALQ